MEAFGGTARIRCVHQVPNLKWWLIKVFFHLSAWLKESPTMQFVRTSAAVAHFDIIMLIFFHLVFFSISRMAS